MLCTCCEDVGLASRRLNAATSPAIANFRPCRVVGDEVYLKPGPQLCSGEISIKLAPKTQEFSSVSNYRWPNGPMFEADCSSAASRHSRRASRVQPTRETSEYSKKVGDQLSDYRPPNVAFSASVFRVKVNNKASDGVISWLVVLRRTQDSVNVPHSLW